MNREFAIQRLGLVRDYFVFSCFTGVVYIDVVQLKPTSIVIGADGAQWLTFSRQKTATTVRVPILEQALRIVEKYSNHPAAVGSG